MAEWNVVAKARNDFADMLEGLSEEQLAEQSLCDAWSVADVGGHLVSLVEMSSVSLVMGYLKNRSDPDGFISAKAQEFSGLGAESLVQSLRARAGDKLRPYSEASVANDIAVHTQDVRRPLGLSDPLDPEVLQMALDFSTNEFASKRNSEDALRFVATDMDWSWGAGPEIKGTAEALLMALNKRDVARELDGPGVELLG